MKRSYAKSVLEVYGKERKVSSEETFENYLFVLADIVSSTVFVFSALSILNTGILIYTHGLTRGPFVMFIIGFVFVACVVIRNGRASNLRIKTTIKLINLRLKIFIFRITLP
ncbi:hypothetical protein [Serratia fonticola]|uniref:hypothetical protein n=1 Tax=Serratia fonticola TaxID=47917 RepID=UPI00217816E0|nr:hypothetical protein [Serratia fonticola]CAI1750435.1 Uncharacterised protein [Serratia fonticola]